MKAILVIADGMGGRPSDIEGRTCLEAARTPNLDTLASRGATGLVDPIGPGIRPGSDTAHLSLLGYDPYKVYTGRGVFECLGIGMDVRPGDVCFRANFATVEKVDGGLRLLDRRAGRIESGQEELASALTDVQLEGIRFEFRASTQHRGALLLRGDDLSARITENDPHKVGAMIPDSLPIDAHDSGGALAAAAVNDIARASFALLNDHPINSKRRQEGKHPANVILVRGASTLPHLASVEEMFGVRGAVIAGGALYRGVGLACGMDALYAPGITGGLDTDLGVKARTAIDALDRYDYVFVHIKGTDNAGHDKDAVAKREFIERIDSEFFGPIMEQLDWKSTHLAFTGDHTTPIDYGDHTAEPVPVLFVGPNVRSDSVTTFGEKAAAGGGLCRFSGRILPMLLNYNNWAPKFGS